MLGTIRSNVVFRNVGFFLFSYNQKDVTWSQVSRSSQEQREELRPCCWSASQR